MSRREELHKTVDEIFDEAQLKLKGRATDGPMTGREYVSKWGDSIELDLQERVSYITLETERGEMLTVTMNNKNLADMAIDIIKGLC